MSKGQKTALRDFLALKKTFRQKSVIKKYIYIHTHTHTHTQDAAEMVKHFKILVTCFSARVSRSVGF